MEPTQGAPPRQGEPADRTKVLLLVLVALLAIAVVALALVVALRGGEDGASPGASPTPSPTVVPSTSSAPTSSTSSSATTATALRDDEARTVVWPRPGSGTTYGDPVDAAAGMVTELAGFTSPVVGPFQQGDSRSGEVGIKPDSNGPVSTVLVRQLSDNHWYVIGMVCDDLQLQVPDVGAAVSSPVRVSGRSTAFEGVILVSVLAQADPQPLGSKPLIGGSNGQLGPFSGTIDFDAPGTARAGAIMLTTHSAKDGSVWQASIVPVMLAAG